MGNVKAINDLLKKLEIKIRDDKDRKTQLILITSIRVLVNESKNGN